jgi:hypothetical protein
MAFRKAVHLSKLDRSSLIVLAAVHRERLLIHAGRSQNVNHWAVSHVTARLLEMCSTSCKRSAMQKP